MGTRLERKRADGQNLTLTLLSTAKFDVTSRLVVSSLRLYHFAVAGGNRKHVTSPTCFRDALNNFMQPVALMVGMLCHDASLFKSPGTRVSQQDLVTSEMP